MSLEKTREENRRKSDLCLIIREFCLNTTVHGLPGVARSQSLKNRLFWLTSSLIFAVIMVCFIIKAILTYFEYPTKMNINIINEWPQYFPAVSFCNGSPFRADKFLPSFALYLNRTGVTEFSEQEANYVWSFIIDRVNRNESIEPFFYPLSSILYSCVYNDRICSEKDFIPFLSSYYGLCYTFNAKLKDKDVRYSHQDGGYGNLELGIYVHSHQYLPIIRPGIGISIIVHDNVQIPLIETSGLHLSPGKVHRLIYRKKKTFLLPPPYSSCTNKITRSMEIMFENYHGADYAYTAFVCYQLCTQVYIYEQCNCVNPYLWNARSIIKPGTDKIIVVPLCHDDDQCFKNATNTLLSSATLLEKYCSDCPAQCSTTEFSVQTSFLTGAFDWQIKYIKRFVERSSIPLSVNWSNTWQKQINENYLVVSVLRETTIIENNTQSPAINGVVAISNVGGQTGLWMGISFLSIIELIEMFYRLMRVQYYRLRRITQTEH